MSGSGIVSAQGTVVFGVPPAAAAADPCVPLQPSVPVAQRSTLSPNASPFVPKNFSVPVVAAATPQTPFAAAATAPAAATVADSDMSYAPPLPPNVQTIYVTGLPGYYASYVPTPAMPFYTMQYQCLYQPTPPMGVCCPMEESMPSVADEPPVTAIVAPATAATSGAQQQPLQQQLQQPMVQNARRNKKKSRSGRRRESAPHRDAMTAVDANTNVLPEFGQASGRSGAGAARVTTVDREEWQGGLASPDFSSSSEFPSLSVQDFPQRQSPSGISYSTALQQQKAPRPPAVPSGATTNRDTEELGSSTAGVNTRSIQQGRRGGGNSSSNSPNDANNKHHKRGSGSRKHRRGGGGGGAGVGGGIEGVRRVEDTEPSTRMQHHQQERRGPKRSGGGAKAAVPAIDGGAEKHQFEAPEKDKSELRHETEAVVQNVPRIGSGRMPHQNSVRVNAARGRRDTRHSSLLRGVLKGDGTRQYQQQGGRGGGNRKGSDADRHVPAVEVGLHEDEKPALRRSWNSGSPARQKDSVDEYPPLGSRGTEDSLERSPEGQTTKADTKDAMVKHGDNIPKQHPQPPLREKGSKHGPMKPLASTNGGSSGPKHKTAISMAIADIMVPKQRQPKKLKEKENLLERSSKKPEVARSCLVANRLDSSAPSKKRGKERETPARRKLSVMKKIILKEREERRQRHEKLRLVTAARQSLLANSAAEVVVELARDPAPTEGHEDSDPGTLPPRTLPDVAAAPQEKRLHSTRFRDYCDHVQTPEINLTTKTLLTDLVFFQERLYQKDPIKARSKRRLVYGLKEVRKYLLLNKLKCIIFAPDIEEVKAEGGLDHSLGAMIEYARAHFVPTVFALRRRLLGTLAKKNVAVSCIGIFDYSARETQFKQLLELVSAAKKTYAELKERLAHGDSPSDASQGEDNGDPESRSLATSSGNALCVGAIPSAGVIDDGWVTTNEESDTEDPDDSLTVAKVETSTNVDSVARLLALTLRSAGRES
ncbi:uncharacterized protein Sbp2 [Dermacentor albipictus]|uniref:uncharacterized protein Sbp2 n=1 Tax=Dermacentor albipictus TaxID=60249 RepID=UPI0031FDB41B